MSVGLEELVSMAQGHIELYETLAGLLSLEQAALIDMDLEELQKVSKAKETTALKIKIQVPALAGAIMDAARELRLGPEPLPTLAELANHAPKPYDVRLERSGLALARLKRGILRHNEDNHGFVQTALEMFNGTMAATTGAVAAAPKKGYTASGRNDKGGAYGPVRLSREV